MPAQINATNDLVDSLDFNVQSWKTNDAYGVVPMCDWLVNVPLLKFPATGSTFVDILVTTRTGLMVGMQIDRDRDPAGLKSGAWMFFGVRSRPQEDFFGVFISRVQYSHGLFLARRKPDLIEKSICFYFKKPSSDLLHYCIQDHENTLQLYQGDLIY